MKYIFLIFGLLMFLTGCFLIKIERLESRTTNDGSTSLSSSDSAYVKQFKIENFGVKKTVGFANEINFETVNYKNVMEIISRNEKTLITFWASWCPVCHTQLAKYGKISDSLNQIGIQAVLISQNFNISYMQKILFKDSIYFQTYILQDSNIGTDEVDKQDRLLKKFDADIKNNEGGVPASVLFNKAGKVIALKNGLIWAKDFMKY